MGSPLERHGCMPRRYPEINHDRHQQPQRCHRACRRHRRPVHAPGGAVRGGAGAAQPGRARPAGGGGAAASRATSRSTWRAGRAPWCGVRAAACAAPSGSTPRAAMLEEARAAGGDGRASSNVAWHQGDVYALPFADGALRHRQLPLRASTTSRRRRARSPRWCACAGRAAASCCATPWPPTIRPRPRPSTPWSGSAIPRRWSSARSAFCAACSPTPGCAEPEARFYGVPAERERLIACRSPPATTAPACGP